MTALNIYWEVSLPSVAIFQSSWTFFAIALVIGPDLLFVGLVLGLVLVPLPSLRLWRTGQTFGSIMRRWHRKSGSMPGMSEADHAKASKCRVITSAIWSCVSWPRDFFPSISLSSTSPAGSGRHSRAISARVTPSLLWGWLVTEHTPLFVFKLFS